jgi:hypothetical protein
MTSTTTSNPKSKEAFKSKDTTASEDSPLKKLFQAQSPGDSDNDNSRQQKVDNIGLSQSKHRQSSSATNTVPQSVATINYKVQLSNWIEQLDVSAADNNKSIKWDTIDTEQISQAKWISIFNNSNNITSNNTAEENIKHIEKENSLSKSPTSPTSTLGERTVDLNERKARRRHSSFQTSQKSRLSGDSLDLPINQFSNRNSNNTEKMQSSVKSDVSESHFANNFMSSNQNNQLLTTDSTEQNLINKLLDPNLDVAEREKTVLKLKEFYTTKNNNDSDLNKSHTSNNYNSGDNVTNNDDGSDQIVRSLNGSSTSRNNDNKNRRSSITNTNMQSYDIKYNTSKEYETIPSSNYYHKEEDIESISIEHDDDYPIPTRYNDPNFSPESQKSRPSTASTTTMASSVSLLHRVFNSNYLIISCYCIL